MNLPISKENVQKEQEKFEFFLNFYSFAGVFRVKPAAPLNQSPADYLWSEISDKFEKVIPKKYYDFDKSVKSLAEKAERTRIINEESEESNKIALFPLKRSL